MRRYTKEGSGWRSPPLCSPIVFVWLDFTLRHLRKTGLLCLPLALAFRSLREHQKTPEMMGEYLKSGSLAPRLSPRRPYRQDHDDAVYDIGTDNPTAPSLTKKKPGVIFCHLCVLLSAALLLETGLGEHTISAFCQSFLIPLQGVSEYPQQQA